MIKFKVYSLEKVKQKFILEAEKEYIKRISGAYSIEIFEFKNIVEFDVKKIQKQEFLIVMDEKGKNLNTIDFYKYIQKKKDIGTSNFSFIIGNAFGIEDKVKKEANLLLSLSSFTMPYQLSRLILVEQIYRCMTLMENIPYHKS